MKYPTLHEAIHTFFGYNSGEHWEEHFADELASSSMFRAALTAELSEAMSDQDFAWLPLLAHAAITNNEEIATEAEAKAWVERRLVAPYLSKYS